MEKFNYYFNTQEKIDNVLNGPINKSTMSSVLFHLVWYSYYNISKNEDEIIEYIKNWMQDKSNAFHLSVYAKSLRNYIGKMKKMPWRDICDTVKIRQSELDYISSFNDIKKEKLLFCYLAVAKFADMSRKTPSHWESESDTVIFKMAHVNIPAAKRDYFIHELIFEDPKAKIHLSYKIDDLSKRIDYISDDDNDPVVLELDESNYRELAFTYLNWKNGGGYKKCKCCGKLFKVRKSSANEKSQTQTENATLYCKDCSKAYETKYKNKDIGKKITCIDCGDEFYLENYAMGTRIIRCEECQNIAKKDKYNRYNVKRRSLTTD